MTGTPVSLTVVHVLSTDIVRIVSTNTAFSSSPAATPVSGSEGLPLLSPVTLEMSSYSSEVVLWVLESLLLLLLVVVFSMWMEYSSLKRAEEGLYILYL